MKTSDAVKQLEMVAKICTTTPLAEAALMGARALEKHTDIVRCVNCQWWIDGCMLKYSDDPYGYCHRGEAKYGTAD